ncbi:MAG: hypothetical protein HY305_00790 [Sphingobacteriales bacterium]|nr:hypothetical protein [Sphingobacteriales bacterium]
MKKIVIALTLIVFLGCKNEKGSDSNFQKEMMALGQEYLDYKKENKEYEAYKVYHDTILMKMRRLTIQKRLDTVTAKVIKIEPIMGESYEVTYQDGVFIYRALIIFRKDIDIKNSPFYKYKQPLSVGQVVDLPLYMLEASSLGINSSSTNAMFNMSDGSIEMYIWPIPEGVNDIKLQMQKDLYNTWGGNANSFE